MVRQEDAYAVWEKKDFAQSSEEHKKHMALAVPSEKITPSTCVRNCTNMHVRLSHLPIYRHNPFQ